MATKQLPVWGLELEGNSPDNLNHASRRTLKHHQHRQRKRLESDRVVTEQDIPPGSLLAEHTIQAIRNGELTLTHLRHVLRSPEYSKQPARKRKRQIAKASRKRNRGR
jgi:hypothetical protein